MNIAQIIKRGRIECGFTQQQLAQKLNTGRSSILNWESGQRIPGGDMLLKIAQILNLKDEFFRHGEKDKISSNEIKKILKDEKINLTIEYQQLREIKQNLLDSGAHYKVVKDIEELIDGINKHLINLEKKFTYIFAQINTYETEQTKKFKDESEKNMKQELYELKNRMSNLEKILIAKIANENFVKKG